MEMDKRTLTVVIPAIFAIIWLTGGTMYFALVLAQNTTGGNTTLPTGDTSVPVETPQGQIEQAAPAESIVDLFNYILIVAIPAIVALGGMIMNMIRASGLAKKYEKELVYVESGFKATDTMMPKIKEQISDSGLAKFGYEIITKKLDEMKPGTKAEIDAEVQEKVPEIKAKVKESVDQMNELRSRVPPEWLADRDKKIPRLADGTVNT